MGGGVLIRLALGQLHPGHALPVWWIALHWLVKVGINGQVDVRATSPLQRWACLAAAGVEEVNARRTLWRRDQAVQVKVGRRWIRLAAAR